MLLFAVAGPSASGKSSIIKRVLAQDKKFRFSVSCTTRKKREGEVNGRDYYFITREQFQSLIDKKLMLEWAEVYGHFYGTPIIEIGKAQETHQDLILDIDCQGAKQIEEKDLGAYPKLIFRSVFVLPPSSDALEARLRGRGDTADIESRLRGAAAEVRQAERFTAWVENDRLERAVNDIMGLVPLLRMRVKPDERRFRNQALLDRVSSTFLAQPA